MVNPILLTIPYYPWIITVPSHICNTLNGGDSEKALNNNINTTSIYINNTLDTDYDNTLRGNKSMCKGVEWQKTRE